MSAHNLPVTITGRAAVAVSKYTGFDLSNPDKTEAHEFVFLNPARVNDGVLDWDWSKDGYRFVGWAAISIQLLPSDTMLQSAVSALQAEKQAVIADAQRRATEIDGEIQKLLAITYEAKEQS